MCPILIRSLVTIALAVLRAANISRMCTRMGLFKLDPSLLYVLFQNDKGEKNPSFIDLNTFDEAEKLYAAGTYFTLFYAVLKYRSRLLTYTLHEILDTAAPRRATSFAKSRAHCHCNSSPFAVVSVFAHPRPESELMTSLTDLEGTELEY